MTRRPVALADLVAPAVIVAAMSMVASFGFRGIFPDWSFLPAAAIGAIGATLMMFLARAVKATPPEAVVVSLVAFCLLGAVAAEGVPTPAAFATFFDGLIGGWAKVLSSTPPAEITAEFRVLPYTVAWVAAMIGCEILRSTRTPGLPAIGPVIGLGFSLLITLEDRAVALVQGAVIVVGTLLLGFLQQRQNTQDAEMFEDVTIEHPKRHAGVASAVGVVVVAAVLAPLLGPRLPLAAANERFDLREYQVPPFDPLEEPSPLVQIKAAYQDEHADLVMFTVTSETPMSRFPTAVLDHFNSDYWSVANEAGDPSAEFAPVDSQFPPPIDATIDGHQEVQATIEIRDYDQIAAGDFDPAWVPTLGWPVSIASEQDLDLRFNLESGTVALVPGGPSGGLVYDVVSAVPPPIEGLSLAGATVSRAEEFDLAVPQLRSFAGDTLEGADVGWEQIESIRVRLVDQGFYDSRADSDTGRSGHSLGRLAEFVNDPERIVGFEEQYAATAGLVARSQGLPARVVVGFRIPDDELEQRWSDGRLDVLANDMSAWVEVNFDGIGWIPFDVTPPRDREPEDISTGLSRREVAVPNPPPDPPPPVLPPELDREAELEEEDEEEEDEQEDEETTDSGGVPVGAIAMGVGISSPLLLLIAAAIVVIVVKRRRTARRRNASVPSIRVAGAWHEVVDRCSEMGATPRNNATSQEYTRGLQAADVIGADEVGTMLVLAREADEAAFHPTPATDDDAVDAWDRSDHLVQSIANSQGPVRRFLRRVDPRPLLRRDPILAEESDD